MAEISTALPAAPPPWVGHIGFRGHYQQEPPVSWVAAHISAERGGYARQGRRWVQVSDGYKAILPTKGAQTHELYAPMISRLAGLAGSVRAARRALFEMGWCIDAD